MASEANGKAATNSSGDRDLQVYVDLRSPFSFIGKDQIRALAREFGLNLVWHPYAIDIAAAYGDDHARDARELRKVKYLYMDARRVAEPLGLAIKGPKKIFDATNAHLGMLYARANGMLDPYLDLVYERFFLRELDVEDRAAILDVLTECGADIDAAADYMAGAAADELAAETRAAEENGVFAVPSCVYAGELYWGVDRLSLLRRTIADSIG
ncbi:MAG: DsbA family protein [Methyloligellaceae bacterium]